MRESDEIIEKLRVCLRQEALEDLKSLVGGVSVAQGPGARGAKVVAKAKPKPAKRTMRTPESIEKISKDLLSYMKRRPGSTMAEIRQNLGLELGDVQFPMRKLRDAKAFTTKGAGAKMRYTLKAPKAPAKSEG